MKKIAFLITFLAIASVGAYIFYRFYLPDFVADAMTKDDVPDYLPKRVQKKIAALKAPVNAGAEEVVKEIHKANIPMDKVLAMIDNTTEDQAYTMLDELNHTKPNTTDQVFDIAKKYFPADFDIEVLRKPFNQNVNIKMIKKGIQYGNTNRKRKNIDIEVAKEIAKKILIEKEKEFSLK